ncbi:MAG: MFS transporter [Hamadaea sp.]|uniref:MDR family MFS transporter n=1 Tax=Hamadaea sp. TaxID=2024425 RepID=UPI001843C413|nr:MFS transporter [Hamadaea sp.]NUR73874.1 MFS transporter [Hamadaea sp.]NUT19263.1 MFS transporter [Hamadaea sp.]
MRRWLRDTTGGLPRPFWYLWFGTLINRVGGFVVIFLTIYLTTVRHFTPSQAGLIMGVWAAGGALGNMLGGVAADRIGRKVTLLTGQVGGAATLIAMAYAKPYWAIAGLAFLFGVFADGARPAFGAMLIDIVPEKDRLRAFTLSYWVINLGFSFAATLAGLAAAADYHLVFLIDAATTIVTATFLFFTLKETRAARPATSSAAAPSAARGGLRIVFTDRIFLTFAGLNILGAFVFLQHLTTLPIAMAADGISGQTYGYVIALNGVLIVLGQLFIPRMTRGMTPTRMLALAAIVTGVGFGLTAFANTPLFYAFTVFVWTLGEMVNAPANSTTMAALSPADLRGRYQGVFSLSWSIAGFVAPTAGGFLQEHLGNTFLWLLCAAVGLVVAAAQVASGPARERRAAILAPPPSAVSRQPAPVS